MVDAQQATALIEVFERDDLTPGDSSLRIWEPGVL